MANENMVTISLDEYFDLRQKATMNEFLMAELGRMNERYEQHDRRIFNLEDDMRRLKNGK